MDRPNVQSLARPSANTPPPSVKEPTRLEILKTKKGRPFAGEVVDLDADFKITTGIINYTGHRPGLHSAIGTGYPNLMKKSGMFLEEKGKPGWGGPNCPINDATHDKWGSMKPLPDQLKKDIANLYLSTAHPAMPIDPSIGVGYSPARHTEPPSEVTVKYFGHTVSGQKEKEMAEASAQRQFNGSLTPARMGSRGGFASFETDRINSANVSHARASSSMARGSPSRNEYSPSPSNKSNHNNTSSSCIAPPLTSSLPIPAGSSRIPMDAPKHIAGYKGYMPGTRHLYGENWNRIDHRSTLNAQQNGPGGKGITASVMAQSPQRLYGEYETHNLKIANRNAIPH